jgi:class III poly(R)-hydroxyalkanoic acid synthase PhaE subunit
VENANDYFNAWLKSQNQMFESLREQAKHIQGLYQGTSAAAQNPFEAWQKAAQDAFSTGADADVLKSTLHKTFGSSNAFQKLYEVWQPLLKAIQSRTMNQDAYKDLMDPIKVKELVDKLFKFDAENMAQLQKQMTQFSAQLASNSEHFVKPWLDAGKQNLQSFPHFAEGHPAELMKMFHTMFNAFDSTVGRSFHVPAVGKDREKLELMSRCIDDMSVYAAKNAEYQHMMYLTALNAMEKVMAELAKKIEVGETIDRFDGFLDLWVDVNEKTYFALFQTEEFSQLKDDVLAAGLNARQHYFKLMEMHLFDLPIALRSEMDDLYKTIYELRKTVKKMESQMKKEQPA